MAKLTDSQRNILSKAAAREDGAAVVPTTMNKATAMKIGASLVARKFLREVKSKTGMPIWNEDNDGRSISLLITRSGRAAIGVVASPKSGARRSIREKTQNIKDASRVSPDATSTKIIAPRAGSKKALLISMLSAENGATTDALTKATGWLPHTTRATLTGLRQAGYAVERFNDSAGVTAYRIISVAALPDSAGRARRRPSAGEPAAVSPTARFA